MIHKHFCSLFPKEIATREGWRVLRHNRGYFEVVEIWIENSIILELFPPELQSTYANFAETFKTQAAIDQYLAAINAN